MHSKPVWATPGALLRDLDGCQRLLGLTVCEGLLWLSYERLGFGDPYACSVYASLCAKHRAAIAARIQEDDLRGCLPPLRK